MRRYLIVILLFICLSSTATRRALIIGIGTYPQQEENYWNPINGDNDVTIVRQMLLSNNFLDNNIATLVNQNATYHSIIVAFKKLVAGSQIGDVVYIHFSGHGQLISDMNGDEGDYGWDESWIPYDAKQVPTNSYHGQNHLVDDEINFWLHALRRKVGECGKIIVVADACHSAGATRSCDEDVVRGTSINFLLHGVKHKSTIKNSEEWVYISACGSNEMNRQCKDKPYGSLTYALYMLKDSISQLTVNQLLEAVNLQMKQLLPRSQTPHVDGPPQLLSSAVF